MKVMNCIMALLTMGLLVSCSSDDGNRITKTYDIADFDALSVSHAFEVEVMPSDMESVEVVVSAKLEKYLLVEKKGSTLNIGLKSIIAKTKRPNIQNETSKKRGFPVHSRNPL